MTGLGSENIILADFDTWFSIALILFWIFIGVMGAAGKKKKKQNQQNRRHLKARQKLKKRMESDSEPSPHREREPEVTPEQAAEIAKQALFQAIGLEPPKVENSERPETSPQEIVPPRTLRSPRPEADFKERSLRPPNYSRSSTPLTQTGNAYSNIEKGHQSIKIFPTGIRDAIVASEILSPPKSKRRRF